VSQKNKTPYIIPPRLKDTAALPCETVMFQKLHKFKNAVAY